MKDKKKAPENDLKDSKALRRKAEKKLQESFEKHRALSDEDIKALIHKLQVHQIELEMQNDELKRTQERLEESRSRYVDLYDFAPIGYFTIDNKGCMVEMNLTGAALLGAERSYLIKKPFGLFVHKEDVNKFHLHRQQTLKSEVLQLCEIRLIRKDGTEFHADLRSIRVKDIEGGTDQIRITAINITDRKKAEAKLQKTLKKLEHSNALLKQFIFIASHDLKEPLRNISGFTDLLETRYKGKLDKDADEYIGFILDGTSRMRKLIDDLLAYSHVNAENRDVETVDCRKILMRVIANLSLDIENADVKITFDELPVVTANAMLMEQLLQNLILNGIKFHGETSPLVHVSAAKKSDEWVFSVKDNGIGIDAKYFGVIFDMFKRLHGQSEYDGTGIGLAICKKIVELHGGRLWVKSEPGKGSMFYFTIPV